MAILVSILIVLLQLLALRFSYEGAWATSVGVFQDTLFKGACVDGEFLLEPYLVRWCLGIIALLCVACAWVYVIFWTLQWLVVQVPYLFLFWTSDIRWLRKGPDSADQCEKAAGDMSSDGTEPDAEDAPPHIDASSADTLKE